MTTTGTGSTPAGDALRASIAYEWSQPLCAIVASAAACSRWLSAKPPNLDRAQRALERIGSEGRRAGELIDGTCHFDFDQAILEVLSVALPV